MGNRAYLAFGTQCEFEANNTIPVTWLALFESEDYVIERRHEDGEDGEDYGVAIYRTSQSTALPRVEKTIHRLKGQTPIWAYLRPLEILRDELEHCSPGELIELDVTQFWQKDEVFRGRAGQAAAAFAAMMDQVSGDERKDLAALDELVNKYRNGRAISVVDLHPEDKMLVLIGTYWGDQEEQYSLEYFDEAYWTAGP